MKKKKEDPIGRVWLQCEEYTADSRTTKRRSMITRGWRSVES